MCKKFDSGTCFLSVFRTGRTWWWNGLVPRSCGSRTTGTAETGGARDWEDKGLVDKDIHALKDAEQAAEPLNRSMSNPAPHPFRPGVSNPMDVQPLTHRTPHASSPADTEPPSTSKPAHAEPTPMPSPVHVEPRPALCPAPLPMLSPRRHRIRPTLSPRASRMPHALSPADVWPRCVQPALTRRARTLVQAPARRAPRSHSAPRTSNSAPAPRASSPAPAPARRTPPSHSVPHASNPAHVQLCTRSAPRAFSAIANPARVQPDIQPRAFRTARVVRTPPPTSSPADVECHSTPVHTWHVEPGAWMRHGRRATR